MNTQTQNALKMAQEVLNLYCEQLNSKFANNALKAIDEALEQPAQEAQHDLYTDADKDKPSSILDSNGQVALALCKKCGKGEIELDASCIPQEARQPTCWITAHGEGFRIRFEKPDNDVPLGWMKLYDHPKEWQGLSADEIDSLYEKIKWDVDVKDIVVEFYHAIEQALKEKNTWTHKHAKR